MVHVSSMVLSKSVYTSLLQSVVEKVSDFFHSLSIKFVVTQYELEYEYEFVLIGYEFVVAQFGL